MSALEEVPEEVGAPEVEAPEEAPPPEPIKRGRGRPRKDPTAPPKPKKQALVVTAREEPGQEAPKEARMSDVDRILYLFKEREIEEQRRKSEQYRVMLGL